MLLVDTYSDLLDHSLLGKIIMVKKTKVWKTTNPYINISQVGLLNTCIYIYTHVNMCVCIFISKVRSYNWDLNHSKTTKVQLSMTPSEMATKGLKVKRKERTMYGGTLIHTVSLTETRYFTLTSGRPTFVYFWSRQRSKWIENGTIWYFGTWRYHRNNIILYG